MQRRAVSTTSEARSARQRPWPARSRRTTAGRRRIDPRRGTRRRCTARLRGAAWAARSRRRGRRRRRKEQASCRPPVAMRVPPGMQEIAGKRGEKVSRGQRGVPGQDDPCASVEERAARGARSPRQRESRTPRRAGPASSTTPRMFREDRSPAPTPTSEGLHEWPQVERIESSYGSLQPEEGELAEAHEPDANE